MNASEILNQRLNFANYKYKFGGDGSDAGVTKHIDCSHLVHSMLFGAGYMIPYQTTADLCSSKYFDIIGADEAKPGDLILWRKVHQHVGVLESITPNADTNQPFGDFFGSQTSTGPASTKFGTDNKGLKHYWPIPDKFLRPKSCYYHGPGNTKSTDPIPRVPSKTSSHSKDKLEKAQQVREEIQEQWSMPSPVEQESDDGYATKMPANMGFFPVGTNLTWHGGIHCLGDSDHSVHCMFDGVVVAARLPEKDSAEPVHGSRNFVLVKHKTAQGDVFWSLYMHLQPIPLKDHDAKMLKALPWLYELELCSEGRGESNFRPLPSRGAYFNPPRTILPGERFVLIDEHEADGFHWCHVQSKRDGIKGWVAKTSRIRISPVIHRGDSLRAGEVVRFDHPIQAGACLGFVSSPNSQQAPFVHVEIFSETLLSGGWTAVCDRDEDDVVCDAEGLKRLMNCAEDVQFLEPLTAGLIRETYADQAARARIWARAYQFKSEWSVDWEDALKRYDPEIARRQGPQFNLYRFWSEAESAGCDLPKGGKPYHYQPLVFREVMFSKKESVAKRRKKIDEDSIKTNWPQYNNQNIFDDLIMEAAEQYAIRPILLKSLIAQESAFHPKAHNKYGYAGLTQIGGAAIKEAGLRIGKTCKKAGVYCFDMEHDERFNPRKSIFGGASIFSRKRTAINRLIFSSYSKPLEEDEREKFYLAAYNAGEGTVQKAYKYCRQENPTWDTLVDGWKTSYLWCAIPESWGKRDKYKEITMYVCEIIMRSGE